MKLLFATGNHNKYLLMKERLKDLKEIEVITPKMLDININVIEDGNTPVENAIKKAKQYYDVTKLPVIAEDSGLYIDKFLDEEQPGLFVRRVNGREDLTNEEVLKHYIDLLNKHGGESLAAYHTGVCLIDDEGNINSELIEETKFLMTSRISNNETISGGVLDSISYDLNANKYFCERSEEDKKKHYKLLDSKYNDLVKKYILKR